MRASLFPPALLGAVLALVALAATASASAVPLRRLQHDRRDAEEEDDFAPASSNSSAQMAELSYMGGKLLSGPVKIYNIWYGDWNNTQSSQNLVSLFINNIASTTWWNTVTRYRDDTGARVSGPLQLYGTAYDFYSAGDNLTYADHNEIVTSQILQGNFPLDPTGLYLVLLSADVKSQDFCTSICGYHSYAPIAGQKVVIAVIMDGMSCDSCRTGNPKNSPNHAPGIDAMINVLAHELTEALSDPFLDAWVTHTTSGSIVENADKCNLLFGNRVKTLSNSAKWNLEVGGEKFYIQLLWDPRKKNCVDGDTN